MDPTVYVSGTVGSRQTYHPDPGCRSVGQMRDPIPWPHSKAVEIYELDLCTHCAREYEGASGAGRRSLRDMVRAGDIPVEDH